MAFSLAPLLERGARLLFPRPFLRGDAFSRLSLSSAMTNDRLRSKEGEASQMHRKNVIRNDLHAQDSCFRASRLSAPATSLLIRDAAESPLEWSLNQTVEEEALLVSGLEAQEVCGTRELPCAEDNDRPS